MNEIVVAAEAAHAPLGPSGSKRWINCPPSVRATLDMEDEETDYSREGTLGHSLAELFLRAWLDFGGLPPDYELDTLRSNRLWSRELEDAALSYVEIVKERWVAAQAKDHTAQIRIERRVDLSEWCGAGQFGTLDCGLVYNRTLEVIDAKFGRGVFVDAVDNSQIRLYALGFLRQMDVLFEATEVVLTICQPRLDSRTEETMTREDLLAWGDEVVKPAARLAQAGAGDFHAGPWCNEGFCKLRHTCKYRAAERMAEVKAAFEAPPEGESPQLSPEEISAIILKADHIRKWLGDIEQGALSRFAKTGETPPGLKAVHGKGRRVYTDKDAVAARLTEGGVKESLIYERSLLGITEMERTVGKKLFTTLLQDLVRKQPGKLTLVPESDRREAATPGGAAAAIFAAEQSEKEEA